MVEAESLFRGHLDKLRQPQGDSPNPVFRYDPEVEQKAIRCLRILDMNTMLLVKFIYRGTIVNYGFLNYLAYTLC